MAKTGERIAHWFDVPFRTLRLSARKRIVRRTLRSYTSPYRVHAGCGNVRFEGWINLDSGKDLPAADVCWDLSDGIPLPDRSCELVYCEHLLEHFPVEKGVDFLRECRRLLLRPGGVLRVAMPSLDVLLEKSCGDWRDQDWLTWAGFEFIRTRAEMINIAFRWWGHQWLYDREELHRRLREAGFGQIRDMEWGKSGHPQLCDRETRKDSVLICEAED